MTSAESFMQYLDRVEERGEAAKKVWAVLERSTFTADRPAGLMHYWSLSKREAEKYASLCPRLYRVVGIQ